MTTPTSERRGHQQHAVVLVGVLGSMLTAVQVVLAIGHAVSLLWAMDVASDPSDPSGGLALSTYLGAAASISLNVALGGLCLATIATAVRSARRGSSSVPWACVGVIAVVAILTSSGTTRHV